jgi:molybdopterin-containing oxidoreductase family iron-sulfur binding subunit
MAVDLGRCREGCRDCLDACHRAHNVPEIGDPREELKWIWTEPYGHVFPEEEENEFGREDLLHRRVPVLCNHCDNPPCVRVCPTGATWKRQEDGLVMMDWHRCIGCRYCIAACPYGSRSFNWRDPRPFIRQVNRDYPTRTRGVVEKCTFCEELLARGRPPACVAACRDGALVFGDLEDPGSPAREALRTRFAVRRKAFLGTRPQVYYLV